MAGTALQSAHLIGAGLPAKIDVYVNVN